MKHLLILLSILLLSSPLFGNPKGEHTLYRWETSSGIQWREFGDKDIHPQYKGDVENGKPNGLGVIINTNKGKYVGEWKDGKKQGQGTFTYGKGKWEGEKYEGEFKDGYRHGQGTYTWSDGDKYVGEFKDERKMVKEHTLGMMEKSKKGNSRMVRKMVKEHTLGLMETSM